MLHPFVLPSVHLPRHIMRLLQLLLAASLFAAAAPLTAQSYPTSWDPAIMQRHDVKAALDMIEARFPQQVDEWIRITEILGKSKLEQARGEYVKRVFEEEGLQVSVDSIGNVTGVRKGTGGGPVIAIAAHMDVVFPPGTNTKVRRVGDTLFAPGVGDNTASVANMLSVLRVMNATKFTSTGDFIFIGTVQEEIGLKGMEYWMDHNPAPDLIIVPDGQYGVVAYGALGIYWTKYVFTSPGAHTLASRGRPTPVRALSEAIARLYALELAPLPDGAVLNIGQVHGGEIFNSVPQELYFTVDLRSPNPVLLDSLDARITQIVQAVADSQKVGLRVEVDQKSRAGGTEAQLAGARAHPLVQTAIDINRALGISAGMPGAREAVPTGATDANIGVVRKIPSIAIGGSKATGAHQLTEHSLASSALPSTKLLYLLSATFADGVKIVPPTPVVP